MSRSHRKRKPAAPEPAESVSRESGKESVVFPGPAARVPALVVAIATLAWYALLIGMAVADRDAILVNLVQIDDAEIVLIATSKDPQALNVKRVLKGDHPGEVIRLAESIDPVEEDFVFPLRKRGDVWQVVSCRFRTSPQLIYPATDDVVRRIEDAIENPVPRLMQIRR